MAAPQNLGNYVSVTVLAGPNARQLRPVARQEVVLVGYGLTLKAWTDDDGKCFFANLHKSHSPVLYTARVRYGGQTLTLSGRHITFRFVAPPGRGF